MAITDPRDISGLVAWYSPQHEAANYSDGAQLTTVTDLSGNANHATGATVGSAKPLYKATGGPSGGAQRFRFENGGYLALPSGLMGSAAAGEIMQMVQSDYNSSTDQGWDRFGTDSAGNHYPYAGTVYDGFGTTARKSNSPTGNINQWRTITIWSAASDYAFLQDGITQVASSSNTVAWATNPKIGNSASPAGTNTYDTFEGDRGAIVIYNRKLTSGERSDLKTWMDAHPSGGVTSTDANVAAPAATATATAIAPVVSTSGVITAPAATATATAIAPTISTEPEPTEAYYTADIVIGDHEFSITVGDCDLDNPVQVLDNLSIGWEVSESNPWPAQPESVTCRLGLWTSDVVNLDDVVIGTPMSVVLTDIDDNVFGTFHGRVASQAAKPLRNGPAGLAMRYALTGVDYNVDLAELPLTLLVEWPAESADARFARIALALDAVGITFDPPADTGLAAFEAYPVGSTNALALILTHLDQVAVDNGNGPERYIVAPVVVDGVLDRFSCILLDRAVDASLLPATLDVVDGVLTLVFPSLAAEGVVDGCVIDLDLVWNRLKYRAVNQVTVAGETVTARAERPGPPVRLDLATTLTDQAAADLMALMYLPDVDESNGWIADSFRLYGHRRPSSLVPAWFPDHRADPASTSVYVMPFAILNIPPNINLAGNGPVYAGQLVNVELSIVTKPKPQILVDFALRRQLPISAGGDAITWEWVADTFPTITWADVDPDLSWYDVRLARRP